MTESSPRPNRRWRRKVFAIAAAFVVFGYALVAWENNRERAIDAWQLAASERHPLPVVYDSVCSVPFVRDYALLRHIFGRRQITAVVLNTPDADKLLTMPPCPVELVVNTVASTPPEDLRRLRKRFGDAVK